MSSPKSPPLLKVPERIKFKLAVLVYRCLYTWQLRRRL